MQGLQDKDILEIRRLLRTTKLSQVEIGKRYGVSHTVISNIKLRKVGNHL